MGSGRTPRHACLLAILKALVLLLPGWLRREWGGDLLETARERLQEAGVSGRVALVAAFASELGSLTRTVAEARLYRPEFPRGRRVMFEQDSRPIRIAWLVALVVHFAAMTAVIPLGPGKLQAEPERQMTVIKPWGPPEPPPPDTQPRTIKRRVAPVPIPDPTPDEPEPLVSEAYEFDAPVAELPQTEFFVAPPPSAPEPAPEVFRVGADVRAPQLLDKVLPEYPELARRARLECTVVLEARIDRDGNVVDAVALKPCGLGLTEAALAAVSRWRYAPTLVNGRPVEVMLAVSLRFDLQ